MQINISTKLFKQSVIYMLFVCVIGCATTGASKFRNLFEEDLAHNKESIKYGSIPQAIGDLSMLLEMDPKNNEARFLRGLAYQKLEHYKKAINDYDKLIEINANHSKAHYNLGMIYAFKTHEEALALKHFDRFITLEPDHPKAFAVAKIMISIDKKPLNDTSLNLNQLIEDTLAEQGIIRAHSENDIEKRKDLLKDLLKSSPNSPELHFAMAKSLEQEGKIDNAIKSYKNALDIRPTYSECHRSLGQLLLKTKRKDEAKMHLIKASLFKPNHQ